MWTVCQYAFSKGVTKFTNSFDGKDPSMPMKKLIGDYV